MHWPVKLVRTTQAVYGPAGVKKEVLAGIGLLGGRFLVLEAFVLNFFIY
jgi:hypothetical protein